jgi:hypothetical protein
MIGIPHLCPGFLGGFPVVRDAQVPLDLYSRARAGGMENNKNVERPTGASVGLSVAPA